MSTTVELRSGRPVVIRHGQGPAADSIRREASILTAIAGPGVPDVIEFEDGEDGARLVITAAPPADLVHASTARLAASLAAVAEVLARAHVLGIAHGPLRDGDILAAQEGVLLSGWQRTEGATPKTDLVEFGRLLERLASRHRDLAPVAARTGAPDPPTANALAATLRELAGRSPRSRLARRQKRRSIGGLAIGAAAVAVGLGVSSGTSPAPEPPRADSVHVRGNVVERNGRTWTVGQKADVVTVGAWTCNALLPAVLRPSTGTVWLFTAWPSGSAPMQGRAIRTVPGAVRLRVRHEGRCDHLEVITPQGRSTPVV
jgi:hypothetical protein